MKRPTKIGSGWVSAAGKFLHGPRIHQPEKFERIWVGKPYKELPSSRPVIGVLKTGGFMQQSTIQEIDGMDFLPDITIHDDKMRVYLLPFTIKPTRKFDGNYYTYIGLTNTKQKQHKNLRIVERKAGNHMIYLIYRRRKNGKKV
jgi:hypothetical protein